jgi:hypothetical protein
LPSVLIFFNILFGLSVENLLACVLIHTGERQANKSHTKLYPPSLSFLKDFYERGAQLDKKEFLGRISSASIYCP